MSDETVRDAMVPEPTTLSVDDTAEAAGRAFAEREDVRAVFVVDKESRLVGVITRKTLVREVVAAGKHPGKVHLRDIAEPPLFTLDPTLSLDDGFHALEERDFERVPVVEEGGRLVGVLSRAVVQRRLAEDEPPEPDPDEGSVLL
ncbi:MAG TPA: CBS domain-containing protein [Gaiellaceae bacterium]|jgi:predicted transcriptional regulator